MVLPYCEALRLQNQIDIFENALALAQHMEGSPEGLSEEAKTIVAKLDAGEVVISHNRNDIKQCVWRCLCSCSALVKILFWCV